MNFITLIKFNEVDKKFKSKSPLGLKFWQTEVVNLLIIN